MDIFDLSAKLTLNSEDFEKGLSNAEKSTSTFGNKLKTGLATAAKVGAAAVTAVGTATVGVTKSLIDGTKRVAAYGDTIDKGSKKLGISANAYQEWDAILQHSGSSVDALNGAVRTMNGVFGKAQGVIGKVSAAEADLEKKLDSGEISLEEYNEQYDALYENAYADIGALSKLGFSMQDIEDMSGDTDTALQKIIEALQNMPEGAEKSALAQELLGRSSMELGALLQTSAADTEAMRQKVHELGGVLSDEAVTSAAAYQDSLQDLQTAFTGAKNGLMSELMPSITTVMDGLTALFSGDSSGIELVNEGIRGFVENISEQLPTVIPMITSLIENLAVVIAENAPLIVEAAINLIATVIEAMVPVLPDIVNTTVKVLMDNFPVLLSGAIQLFLALVSAIPQILPDLINALPQVISTVVSNLAEPLKRLFRETWDTIVSVFSIAWNGIKQVWGVVANWFNTTIIQPISNFFGGLWKTVSESARNAWNTLKNGATGAWEGIKSVFASIPNWFKDKFSKAWQAVKDVFSAGGRIFDGIKEGITNAFKTVVNAIIGGINKVVAIPFNAINRVLDKLRNLSFLGISPFGWIGSISVPQIPTLARGGIVDNPTLAMIGEAGKEAIVPLENNTGWMRSVAQEMADELKSANNSMLDDIRDTLHAILDNMGVDIVLNDGVIAGRVDRILGQTAMRKMRGNA